MAHHIFTGQECVNFCQYNPNLVTIRAVDNWHSQPLGEPTAAPADAADPHQLSVQDDVFGLEFAAEQWLNLVTNAEQLFNKLLNTYLLNDDAKEQIHRWLFLKQECEECVASDEATSVGCQHRQSLEKIEELTECTGGSATSLEKSSDSQYESETESDFESQHPDFEDKLDGYMERFKDKTDELIRRKLEIEESVGDVAEAPAFGTTGSSVFNQGRRRSLHPGSLHIPLSLTQNDDQGMETGESFQSEASDQKAQHDNDKSETCGLEPYKELKMLSSGNDAKETQIKQVLVDLEGAQKRIEELQHTIQIKEQFITDIVRNSDTRNAAKLKIQRKWSKLEEEYYKTRTQLSQAESALKETRYHGAYDSLAALKNEVDKYRNLARHYEKRLKDIDLIKQIAGDSAKKMLELENSLQCSKRQMEKLKKQLQKEESYKRKLEQELQEDQQKMKDLEGKYNLQMTDLLEKEKKRVTNGDGDRLKWIAEETERLNVMRESSQKLHQHLVQQQGILDKREAFLKEKFCLEKQRDKSIKEVSARISHLENILKEKNSNVEELDEKDELRTEIHNLRKMRDHLLEERTTLDEKYRKDRRLSSTEERKYLECAEAIEAIDAAIEYKNELICGRKSFESEVDLERQQGEQLLMARLMKLSSDELRILLYKYFQKVIDLRESGRRMEELVSEAEHQIEVQAWKIQELKQKREADRLESERQVVALQRDHQDKLHLMLRHVAEESSSSGTEAGRHLVLSRESEISKLKKENKTLRRRLQELESVLHTAAASRNVVRLRSRSASPDQRTLKPLPAPSPTTTVTRRKNKVVIQMNPNTKKSTNRDVLSFSNPHK